MKLEILERLVLRNPFIPHEPFEQQLRFLADFRPEVLYGGAAGGGKSDALLAAALMYVEVPGYAALLLRRSYQDLILPGALIDRAHTWLRGTGARWNEVNKQFTFPSSATVSFGYLEKPRDLDRYQGPQFHFVGFDELTQFTEAQYTYLFSRLRRDVTDAVPLRMRAASNPGSIGHEWVRARFFRRTDDGVWTARTHEPDRRFIPASWRDNPHLDQAEYERALDRLDPVTRKRLKYGSWEDLGSGELFSRDRFVVVDQLHPAAVRNMVRFWDLAASEKIDASRTAGVLLGLDPWGVFWIADVRHGRWTAGDVRGIVRQTALSDGTHVRVRMQQDPGQAGNDQVESYTRLVLPEYDFRGLTMTGSKWDRAKPVAAEVDQGRVRLVRGPWQYDFLNELEAFAEVRRDYAHDDMVDALSGAYHCFISELGGRYEPGTRPAAATPHEFAEMFAGSSPRAVTLRGCLYG